MPSPVARKRITQTEVIPRTIEPPISKAVVGRFFQDNFRRFTGYTTIGTATWNAEPDGLSVVTPNPSADNGWNNLAYNTTFATTAEKSIISVTFIVGNSTDKGLGITSHSALSGYSPERSPVDVIAVFSPQDGLLRFISNHFTSGVKTEATSASRIAVAPGNVIQITLERNEFTFTAQATNLSQGNGVIQVSYSTVPLGFVNPTAGYVSLVANGCSAGTKVKNLSYYNLATKGVRVIHIGDSITLGRDVSNPAQRYTALLRAQAQEGWEIFPATGGSARDHSLCIPEYQALFATGSKYALIMLGRNAQVQSEYTALVNQLVAIGYVPILCRPIPANGGTTPQLIKDFGAWINTQYGSTYKVIDTWTPLKAAANDGLNATYDSGDGTHPNAAGMTLIANTIANAAPELFTSVPPVDQSTALLQRASSYWRFDDNQYLDAKGNRNLTLTGSGVTVGAPLANSGTGSASWAASATGYLSAGAFTLPDEFTIIMLVRPTADFTGNKWILSSYGSDSQRGFAIYRNNTASGTQIAMAHSLAGTTGVFTVTQTLAINTAGFVVMQYRKNSFIRIRLNAGAFSSNTLTGGIFQSNKPLVFGGIFNASGVFDTTQVWQGLIDGAGLWNEILTDSEINYLYNGGSFRQL